MRSILLLLLSCWLLTSCGNSRSANPGTAPFTTVYVVRHAEKDPTPGLQDPPLTPAGEKRAVALRETLEKRRIVAIFTTNTARTRATIAPLATALKLPPIVYDAKKQQGVADQIKDEYRGKAVVVVGHSNTVLPLLEALGATPPVGQINDDEYSYLFEVKLPVGSGAPTVTTRHYGLKE